MFNKKRNSDYALLREAIKKEDKVTARDLLLHNASVNVTNARGASPLHWAIIKFHDLEIVTMLLDRGANIHIKDHRHQKPLEVAIRNNRVQAIALLASKGALVGQDLNLLLIMAIEENNAAIVKILIDSAVQHNLLIDLKKSFFYVAIHRGQLEVMKYIKPYCQFSKPSDLYIPRELVIKSGLNYRECVKLLLKWNFIVNPNSNQDKEFIYKAVEHGHLEIVLKLLKLGIDVNMINSDTGISLLKIACYHHHYEIVENLLKYNAHVNVTSLTKTKMINPFSNYNYHNYTNYSWMSRIINKKSLRDITCLHLAVLKSDSIMTEILLRHGAKIVDHPQYFNVTSIAIRNNCKEIVCIFLQHGVNVTAVNDQRKSLLHFCVDTDDSTQDSRYGIAKLLLDRGATPCIQIPNNTLVFEAIKNRHQKIAQLFLDHHANIQYIDKHGNTSLHKAIENRFDVEFIKTLLKLNSSVDAVNNKMFTPLHNACKYKNSMTANMIQILIQHKANIEAMDLKGWTPLFVACKAGNHDAVRCLLNNNANPTHTDKQNLTPLYVAAQNCRRSSEVVKILLEHKVNVHCMDKSGNSIIHLVVKNNNAELITTLANTQVNFNSVNMEKRTPLHIAVMNAYVDVTKNLIKYGANVNILDIYYKTPLENAVEYMSDYEGRFYDYQERRRSYWHRRYSSENSDEDNSDTDGYVNDITKFKAIITVLKTQILKLKTVGFRVNRRDLFIIDNPDHENNYEYFNQYDDDDDFYASEYEEDCEQEIERIKMEKIGVNKINFYDLLTYSIHDLSRFVKNTEIKKLLELEIYDNKFPLYIDVIRSRFREAKLRYRFVNSAKKYFTANVCHKISDDSVDIILSYLNLQEIKMFIRAIKYH